MVTDLQLCLQVKLSHQHLTTTPQPSPSTTKQPLPQSLLSCSLPLSLVETINEWQRSWINYTNSILPILMLTRTPPGVGRERRRMMGLLIKGRTRLGKNGPRSKQLPTTSYMAFQKPPILDLLRQLLVVGVSIPAI